MCEDYHVFVRELADALIPALQADFPSNRFAFYADHSPIDEQLQKGKRRYAKRCAQCGGILPYGSNQKLCKICFEKLYGVGVLR